MDRHAERHASTRRTPISCASRPAHPSPSFSTTARTLAPSPLRGCSNSGDNLVARLKAGFKDSPQPQLVHVATDGESYGHHHKYGEMALAYALRLLEQDKTVKLTNYASFLEQFPPEFECEIVDNTSWSCAHGIERWRSNCGCNGGKPGWNQAWRAPLRQALDELRDALVPLTEQEGGKLFKDVWAARDAYIQVVLDRSTESVGSLLCRAPDARAHRSGARARSGADGDAAPRAAHVHQLRLVLRRHLGHRDRADDRLRRARAAACAAALWRTGRAARACISRPPGRSPLQRCPRPATAPGSTRRASRPWSCTSSRWPRTTPSARSSRRLPMRRTSSAIASAASPTRFTPPAAAVSPWAARMWPAPSPATRRAFPSPFSTSATRTSPPP